jgi:hypothetical protein
MKAVAIDRFGGSDVLVDPLTPGPVPDDHEGLSRLRQRDKGWIKLVLTKACGDGGV